MFSLFLAGLIHLSIAALVTRILVISLSNQLRMFSYGSGSADGITTEAGKVPDRSVYVLFTTVFIAFCLNEILMVST